ncbi:CU044_5270 family protein [Dactylosporangium cerinum]|uniref:CU044_5270 family protein n=1 Tax=Dactylosporangium cerinum TaxID=1434730 RepID=A0ABV9VXP0_9ACTN
MNDLDLSRLLPAPATPDLPADRQQLLKDHLLREIRAVKPVRRRRLVLVAAAVAVVAVAAAVVAFRATPETRPALVVAVQEGDAGAVQQLLDRIALAAAAQSPVSVAPGQFLYIKSTVAFAEFGGKHVRMEPLHDRQIWLSQDPKQPGLLKERGRTITLDAGGRTNEELVGNLPADPAALLAKAYADTQGQGNGPDQEAFVYVGDHLFESLPSPAVSAALYRAAALIPGVVTIDDAADAIGRHGIAVARTDEVDGIRHEWIFDRETFAYLGQREYAVRDGNGMTAGTVIGITAVLQRAVVDRAGRTP